MIRGELLGADGRCVEGGAELVQQWREQPESRLWLDIEGELTGEVRRLLDAMHCDPLAISDCFRVRHPPKVEAFDTNTFILFRGIASLDEKLELEPQQIGLWVGERHLITVHRGRSVSVEYFWGGEPEGEWAADPAALALRLLHYACGRYLERLLDFEGRLADLEDGLLGSRSEEQMKELVLYRTRLRKLRRIFSYHVLLAEHAWRKGSPHLGEGGGDNAHLRRDLYDRCERLHSLCNMYYELCGDLVEGHISLSSHNLNNTMKILTIISAIFVPMTFLAGIYGMNFEYMPELGWKYAYFAVVGFMALLAVGMLALFRRIRWL